MSEKKVKEKQSSEKNCIAKLSKIRAMKKRRNNNAVKSSIISEIWFEWNQRIFKANEGCMWSTSILSISGCSLSSSFTRYFASDICFNWEVFVSSFLAFLSYFHSLRSLYPLTCFFSLINEKFTFPLKWLERIILLGEPFLNNFFFLFVLIGGQFL